MTAEPAPAGRVDVSHWEADVALVDGGVVSIRPITVDDGDRLVAFHSQLSAETVYRRFFAPKPRLSRRAVEHLVDVDQVDRVALVATLRGELVAVARYDRLDDGGSAEVAFVVRDDHQGRGLGSVLLEHLIAAAAERGVRRFVAEVLPGNRRMVATFEAAGFDVARRSEQGSVHLEFDVAPTARTAAVSAEREHRAEARSITRLLAPSSVAVVGAGRDPGSLGHRVLRNLLAAGFSGPVLPVNPHVRSVAGVLAHASLAEVPVRPDLVVVCVPAAAVLDVARQAAGAGAHGLVVITAGFAEAGPEGRARQAELVQVVRGAGMRLVGPGALGLLNGDPEVRLNASLAPALPPRGGLGFFSQSGGLGTAVLAEVARRGLGVSAFVSAGSRADVSGNDLLQAWEDDDRTDAVLLYLETFGNPRKFARLAQRVARRKPVVAVRSAHVRVAGRPVPAEAVEAMFRSAGVLRVDTLAQMFDVAEVLTRAPLPAGQRVAVLGNSASLARQAADAAAPAGLAVARLSEASARPLVDVLGAAAPGPGDEAVLDLGATAGADVLAGVLDALLADEGVDAVVTTFVPPTEGGVDDVAEVLATTAAGAEKPVVATLVAFGAPERVPVPDRRRLAATVAAREVDLVERAEVPSFASPEVAVQALGRVAAYARWRRAGPGEPIQVEDADVERARRLVDEALDAADGGGAGDGDAVVLAADRLGELLACYGLEVVEQVAVASSDEAVEVAERLGWPVALKADDEALRHRQDLGGLQLDLRDEEALRTAFATVGRRATQLGRTSGLAVQRMVPQGVPARLVVDDDSPLGALVQLSVGGVSSQLVGDVSLRALPLSTQGVDELLEGVRSLPLLTGWRGAPPLDVAALRDVIRRVAGLADDVPQVSRLHLEPVVVSTRGARVLWAEAHLRRVPPVAVRRPRNLD